jgi:hypothetical protein
MPWPPVSIYVHVYAATQQTGDGCIHETSFSGKHPENLSAVNETMHHRRNCSERLRLMHSTTMRREMNHPHRSVSETESFLRRSRTETRALRRFRVIPSNGTAAVI